MNVELRDIASEAEASIQTQADDVAVVQRTLYEIEGLLLERFRDAGSGNTAATRLMSMLLRPGEKPGEFLQNAQAAHQQKSAEGFRISTNPKHQELLGRVVYAVGTNAAEKLPSVGEAFREALDLKEGAVDLDSEPFFAVLFRSTRSQNEINLERRWGRNALLVLYAASQFVTAFHHASDYGRLSVVAMRATVFDIRRALSGLKRTLTA